MKGILEWIPLSSEADIPRFVKFFEQRIDSGELARFKDKFNSTKTKIRKLKEELTAEQADAKLEGLKAQMKQKAYERRDVFADILMRYSGGRVNSAFAIDSEPADADVANADEEIEARKPIKIVGKKLGLGYMPSSSSNLAKEKRNTLERMHKDIKDMGLKKKRAERKPAKNRINIALDEDDEDDEDYKPSDSPFVDDSEDCLLSSEEFHDVKKAKKAQPTSKNTKSTAFSSKAKPQENDATSVD